MGRRSKDKLSCVKWLETSFIHKRSVVDSVVLKAQVTVGHFGINTFSVEGHMSVGNAH